jgi:hypothetical protein
MKRIFTSAVGRRCCAAHEFRAYRGARAPSRVAVGAHADRIKTMHLPWGQPRLAMPNDK